METVMRIALGIRKVMVSAVENGQQLPPAILLHNETADGTELEIELVDVIPLIEIGEAGKAIIIEMMKSHVERGVKYAVFASEAFMLVKDNTDGKALESLKKVIAHDESIATDPEAKHICMIHIKEATTDRLFVMVIDDEAKTVGLPIEQEGFSKSLRMEEGAGETLH